METNQNEHGPLVDRDRARDPSTHRLRVSAYRPWLALLALHCEGNSSMLVEAGQYVLYGTDIRTMRELVLAAAETEEDIKRMRVLFKTAPGLRSLRIAKREDN